MWINSQAHKRIQRRLRFSKRGKYYTRMLLVGFVAAYITPFKFESKYDLEVLWTYFNRDFIGIDLKKDYCKLGKGRLEQNK